jgi:hypothetical protein
VFFSKRFLWFLILRAFALCFSGWERKERKRENITLGNDENDLISTLVMPDNVDQSSQN